jgi:hypothetical protein
MFIVTMLKVMRTTYLYLFIYLFIYLFTYLYLFILKLCSLEYYALVYELFSDQHCIVGSSWSAALCLPPLVVYQFSLS